MPKGAILSDGAYSTVKSFALKGTLLPVGTLQTLVESRDLNDLAARLKGTPYAQAISGLSPPYSAFKFEMAFRQHLIDVHLALAEVTPRGEILRAYYLRYSAANLKTVLKGKALGKSFDELSGHTDLYAEERIGRRDLVVRALSAGTLEEAAKLLVDTEFGKDSQLALKAFKEGKNVNVFDIYIDKAFFRSLLAAYQVLSARYSLYYESSEIEPFLAIEVDGYNTLAVLRGKLWDLQLSEIRDLIVEPTFKITRRELEKIIEARSVQEGIKYLEGTDYRRIVLSLGNEDAMIDALENAFRLLAYEVAYRPFLWQGFGIGVALGVVKLKELEVRNLSAVAFGVEEQTGPQPILQKLVILGKK